MVEDRVVMDPEETDETPSNDVDPNQAELSEAIPVITEEPGSIVTISERTNRYYIFVGSYKFRAYARRHAEELAADGFAVKLITPDNWVGMRVAVGNYANIEEAGVDAQQIRSRYGNEVVISKY
jgi:cell division protein FtsN